MAIMLSIKPEYVEKILNGKKTIEIRKTIPKCPLPVKVYVYCTKTKPYIKNGFKCKYAPQMYYWANNDYNDSLNGKVVAEFTLKEYETLCRRNKDKTTTMFVVDREKFEKYSCLTWDEYCEYHRPKNGKFSNSYAWHIDDLKIYDKPKELSEFKKPELPLGFEWDNNKLTRPPQSWCYCEELEEV